MAHVIFWGKPGCAGNAAQIAVLRKSGHSLQVRDLSAEPWTSERLQSFFDANPVTDWFNRSAPQVKRGDVRPVDLSEADALALLIEAPLPIRRPLMECNVIRTIGFDTIFIAEWIGLDPGEKPVGEACPRPRCHLVHFHAPQE